MVEEINPDLAGKWKWDDYARFQTNAGNEFWKKFLHDVVEELGLQEEVSKVLGIAMRYLDTGQVIATVAGCTIAQMLHSDFV